MNVKRSSTPSVGGTTVVFVARYFVTDVVTRKFLDSLWVIQVRRSQPSFTLFISLPGLFFKFMFFGGDQGCLPFSA